MSSSPNILIVEDTLSLALTYKGYLHNEIMNVFQVETGQEAIDFIESKPVDIILLDLKLPDMDGQDVLKWMQKNEIDTPVIVITAHSSVDVAVEVIKAGAVDFLEKPFNATRLIVTINNVIKQQKLNSVVKEIQKTFNRNHYQGFIGQSLPMQATYKIIEAAAASKASIFITGESGTGKEVCAEAIHRQSPRAKKPFIAINCGAIPEALMESEIFGHVKGAFTGAAMQRDGAATLANGGTLFLDEIGEMDLELQKKLLRFVQTGRFNKVGSSKEESVDVRIVSATNRNPLEDVSAGRFREDLYYRLHVIPIHLAPLRERGDDILLIANHFLTEISQTEHKKFTHFSVEVEQVLKRYNWPGNVRQLQNVIMNIVVLNDDEVVKVEHLPEPLDTFSAGGAASISSGSISSEMNNHYSSNSGISGMEGQSDGQTIRPLANIEREAILRAISLCDDNIPKAAAHLGVSPSTIYRKMQSWETEHVN